MAGRMYGWRPGIRELADYKFKLARLGVLPNKVDLRKKFPECYNQLELGSCTANALAGLIQYLHIVSDLQSFIPSRLFIYYNERAIERTIKSDAGASIKDGIKSLTKQGAPHEDLWKYNIAKFANKPPKAAYADGLLHLLKRYETVDNTRPKAIKNALAQGFPVVGGFSVYESFESNKVAKTGKVMMPGKTESMIGGHAILIVGYSDHDNRYIVRNSWGPSWGASGYFTIPYSYFSNPQLALDFWVGYLAT